MDGAFSYFPGQTAQIVFELLNSDGYRVDSLTDPTITRVFSFTIADGYGVLDGYMTPLEDGYDGYSQPLVKADTGLYYAKLTLPRTAGSLGMYVVDVEYTDPEDFGLKVKSYNVMISAPYGLIGATTF